MARTALTALRGLRLALAVSVWVAGCGDDDMPGTSDAGLDAEASLDAAADAASATDAATDGATARDGGSDSGGPGTGSIGDPCEAGSDCVSGLCVAVSGGRSVCSRSCGTGCPAGWACAGGSCTCTAHLESCNSVDDDCDALVDEGVGTDVGCAGSETCVAGACECPSGMRCGSRCVDPATDPDNCGTCRHACGAAETCSGGTCCTAARVAVDLLFMVDNSNSMAEEQALLAEQLPRLIRGLATGDVNGDGTPDVLPAADLHAGVVTSDMGNGGYPVPTCATTFGDDGLLRTRGDAAAAGCVATYPTFLAFDPDTAGADVTAFARDVTCVARAGTGGCGFEQQLDAVLKAVTPSTSSTAFAMGTVGHADTANAGFLRSDSVLAVVVVSDENDCSALDPEIFDPSSARYTDDLNLRCFHYPEAVQPVSRYVSGLRALRAGAPDRFVFAAITGVPTDLVPDPARVDYDAVLSDPRMIETLDPSPSTNRLLPACNVPGRTLAFPGRRFVQLAQALGSSQSTVASICSADFGSGVQAVLSKISARLGGVCAP